MKTELEIVEHSIVPAEKIQVQKFDLRNVHLHQVLLTISRTMSAMIEMDGANTGAGLSQSESKAIGLDWDRIQTEWKRALVHRSLPTTGGHESHYFVLLMTHNQMLSVGNVRVARALQSLRNLADRMLSADSAGQEYDIQKCDEDSIQQHMEYVTEVLADYVGVVSDTYDRGLDIPAHTHLGVVIPPESMGSAHTYEPSPTRPSGAVPDVADVPSTVPVPGAPV